jgi:hypothetical protein
MATDIRFARLVASLVADTREYSAGLKDSIQVSTSWVEKLKTVVVDKGLSLLVDAAKKAGTALLDLGKRFIGLVIDAAPLEGIGLAFDKMSERVGLSLDALRQAAAGTVSDFDLMRSANVALTGAGEMLGQELGQQLPRLLEIARAAARATGQDVGFLFESLVSGVKRSSPMLIDNTGLVLKLGEANQALADELGIAVSELSAEEKQIALLRATAQAGQAMIDEFGGGQQTAAEAIGVFRAQIKNATDQIGLAFLPVLQAILGPLGEIGGNVGGAVVKWAQRVADAITPVAQWFGILLSEGDALNDFLTELPKPFQDLVKWLTFTVEEGDPLNDFLTNLPEPFQNIVKAVSTVKASFEEAWPAIKETVMSAVAAVLPFLANMRDFFLEQAPVFLAKFQEVWAQVWPAVQNIVAGAINWFKENLPLIQETIETVVIFMRDHVLPAVDNVWAIITTTIGTAVEILTGIITTAMEIITGDWTGAWETIQATTTNVIEGISSILSNFLEGVLNAVGTTTEEFIATWRENWELAKTIAQTLLNDILVGIASKVGAFIGAGKDLMNGLKSGVTSAVQGIIDAVSGAVADAIAAAKALLGIASPSRVFAVIGHQIDEGLAGGIIGNAAAPQMAMAAVTAGVTRMATRTETNYFEQNIYTRDSGLAAKQGFESLRSRVRDR